MGLKSKQSFVLNAEIQLKWRKAALSA